MPILRTLDEVAPILASTRQIAVLGAHDDRARPAFYVPDYLHSKGYQILPVNPRLAGTTLFGETVRASLPELTESPDMVDIFRPPSALMAHLPELLALRPKVVWLQLGIAHAEFCIALSQAGLTVVEDRCTLADHRALALPRVTP